jgi:hypothetical protein
VLKNMRRILVPLLIILLGACEGTGGPPSPDTVADAAGVTFSVEAAAEMLAPHAQLPNQAQVVEALANLWVDYFLLAKVATEDTTLANLDVSSLVEQNVNQEMVLQLRDQVIQVDTALSDEEVQEAYERTLPGARIRARHILLRFPENATPAQIDSVRALAESLRSRLVAGEDFATLARQYSQDTGSGANGGDLGSFGRGEMVPPFEEAAFSLAVGEISQVVETTFGLHIIRVDERIIPPLEGNQDQLRTQLQNRRVAEAESTYVAGIIEAAGVEVHADGFETARLLAETPQMELSPRARERPIVSFSGGAYTVGDLQDWIQFRPAALRSEIQGTPPHPGRRAGGHPGLGRQERLAGHGHPFGCEGRGPTAGVAEPLTRRGSEHRGHCIRRRDSAPGTGGGRGDGGDPSGGSLLRTAEAVRIPHQPARNRQHGRPNHGDQNPGAAGVTTESPPSGCRHGGSRLRGIGELRPEPRPLERFRETRAGAPLTPARTSRVGQELSGSPVPLEVSC